MRWKTLLWVSFKTSDLMSATGNPFVGQRDNIKLDFIIYADLNNYEAATPAREIFS
jgi:hypothetical protein